MEFLWLYVVSTFVNSAPDDIFIAPDKAGF